MNRVNFICLWPCIHQKCSSDQARRFIFNPFFPSRTQGKPTCRTIKKTFRRRIQTFNNLMERGHQALRSIFFSNFRHSGGVSQNTLQYITVRGPWISPSSNRGHNKNLVHTYDSQEGPIKINFHQYNDSREPSQKFKSRATSNGFSG